jgi:putative salt-induced outer membrane protein
MIRVLPLAGLLVAGTAAAEEAVQPNGFGWKASAEFGLTDTSGNAQTTTINTRFRAVHESARWRNRFEAEYLSASDELGTTAKRTVGQAATNYKLDERNYLFGNLRYEDDEFAPYDYRHSETVGYGRRMRWQTQRLDLEAGVGGSHTRFRDRVRDDDGIVRFAGNYLWQVSRTTEFSEVAFTEVGSDNTHSESDTGLKLRINGNLAMKLSYKLLHNSEVPEGTEKLDSITSVTLVYDF